MLESIEYLPIKNEFRVGDVKNLAVMANQKDDISQSYPRIQNNSVSNADMLSQSFNINPVPEVPKVETIAEPVQISSIPNVQNNFNMEASPVDLNVNPVMPEPVNNIPSIDINGLNISSMDTTFNGQTPEANSIPDVPVIEPIGVKDSNGFQVSNQPNIFDSPISEPFLISQEDINKPIENNLNNSQNIGVENIIPEVNVVPETVVSEPKVEERPVSLDVKEENGDNSINEDIILAQIAIEESNVKHYEALAENSKKKIELLKRQVKTTKTIEDNNLENTASNLFNSNGILDEEKVLGKTPMPNIMAA